MDGTLRTLWRVLPAGAALVALAALTPAPAGGDGPTSAPAGNLDYWLNRATPATSRAIAAPPPGDPFGASAAPGRTDALPAVAVFSDGRILAGGLFTTRDRNWEVWVEAEKRWRHIPPILVLSIEAVVVEQALEKEWRWKEMGSDEKVFTGRTKPVRRFLWTFHLIDDSTVTGSVKGQPLWVQTLSKRHGPFVLHERSAGTYGQSLADLVYVKRVVISRREMARHMNREGNKASSRPAAG